MSESLELQSLPSESLGAELAKLDDPWVADEGPLDAELRRGSDSVPRQRGIAFDRTTTVTWDEDRVTVLRAREAEPGVVALRSQVLVRDRFSIPEDVFRIDYLRRGVLLGSRYVAEAQSHA